MSNPKNFDEAFEAELEASARRHLEAMIDLTEGLLEIRGHAMIVVDGVGPSPAMAETWGNFFDRPASTALLFDNCDED